MTKSWILTDIENRVYVESAQISATALGMAGNWSVTKSRLKGGISDGVDIIEVDNGASSFVIVPTRGMNLWRGQSKGLRLGWDSPTKNPVNPMFITPLEQGGLGWLKGFNECIVRCGMNSNGAPGPDRVVDNNGNVAEVMLTLHGNEANLPAKYVEVQIIDGDPAEIVVIGVVEEARPFCPQYRLTTRMSTFVGSKRLDIHDDVMNFADSPCEFEMLYHCNFGQPFLGKDSKLVVPALEVAPRDARAQEDIATWQRYLEPVAGYVEQCYFMDMAARADGSTLAMLRNAEGSCGVTVRWNRNQLPSFTQWKHTTGLNEGYVTGLEPAVNYPNAKMFEREKGRVVTLKPQQHYAIDLAVEVQENAAEVAALEAEIAKVADGRSPVVHPEPIAKWSKLD